MEAMATAPHDFSMLALFLQADWIVKTVMIGLLLASVWCWAIIANRLAAADRLVALLSRQLDVAKAS